MAKSLPFRSKFEARIAKELDNLGVKYEYEAFQYEYEEPLRKNLARCDDCGSKNLVRSGWYTPDFYIPQTKYVIETKGRFTAADRRKMRSVIDMHPNDNIVMLFMRDNKIHKRSTTKYSDWCKANGIDYSIGKIKEKWVK